MATDTREKMVTSATKVLRERGINGTSFAEVLADSGAPRGSISYHFPNGKLEMINAAIEQAGVVIRQKLVNISENGATPSELVDEICQYFVAGLKSTNFRAGCPVAAAAQESYVDKATQEAVRLALDSWVSVVSDCIEAQGVAPKRAQQLATFSIVTVEGALMLARINQATAPLVDSSRMLSDLLRSETQTSNT